MPTHSPAPQTAAVLLIGDELLSGKIRDENGYFLAQFLRRRGIKLAEIATVGDDRVEIGLALRRLAAKADILFTSGGVGPTHDDVTLEAIAEATARPLERHPELEASLRAHYKERINPAALAMADVPRGTQLRAGGGWPVLRLDVEEARIYILPGVPGLLRSKVEQLEQLEGELPQGDGWALRLLHSTLDESKLAPILAEAEAAYPKVAIGSYPRWARQADGTIDYHVRLTFEAEVGATADVEAARSRVEAVLGPAALCDPKTPL